MAEPQKYVLAKAEGEVSKSTTPWYLHYRRWQLILNLSLGRDGSSGYSCLPYENLLLTQLTNPTDLQHRMWLIQHDGLLYTAPIPSAPSPRILDMGCGTGIWSIAFATQHPNSHVLGVDLNPPHAKFIPANCTFAFADAEGDWPCATEPYDFIFGRALAACIRDWPRFMKRCLQHLKPGGWLELNDARQVRIFAEDACDEAESGFIKWFRVLIQEGLRTNGIDMNDTEKHAQQLRDAGFTDVRERVWKWSMSSKIESTEKEKENPLGALMYQNMLVLIESVMATAVGHGDLLGMSEQEALDLAEEAKRDLLENAERRGYYILVATYVGQAPH